MEIMSEKENRINNILNSNNPDWIEEFNKDRTNPNHEDYNYIFSRAESKSGYGSIADQLDMIYWDKINDTNNWVQSIKSIKEKYPK